jgi:hypothetical protein
MAFYNAIEYHLNLNEAEKVLQVIDLDTENVVETFYIGPEEDGVSISYMDGNFGIVACSMPAAHHVWPLSDFNFLLNREGGILAVDIRDVKIDGTPIVEETYDLTLPDAALVMQIDAYENLLTHFSN